MLRMKLLKDCCTKGFYKMSKYRVDFHIHTKFSDGQASPAEIVDAAKALGYHQIAITDHDGIDGLPEALEEGRRVDLTVIPGMELATETASGTELHILGYGMDLADKTLLAAMKELSRRRAARNTKLIAALQEMGYDISEEELRKIQPNDYIGKPVIARALIAKGYASSIPEVFQSKKMLGSETALAIKKEKLSASDAVKLIRESGGLPVLAHPIQAKRSEHREAGSFIRIWKGSLRIWFRVVLADWNAFIRIKMRNRAFDSFRWHKNMTFASPVDRTSTEKTLQKQRTPHRSKRRS